MTGGGSACGAGTLVNAIATGRGAAFGLDFRVTARVEQNRQWRVTNEGRPLPAKEARLALDSAKQVCGAMRRSQPHNIDIVSNIPPQRGLKSSSAVSVAVIRACLDAHDATWSVPKILKAAAAAGLSSGTSITGAYDDAAACLLGGVVVTDNRQFRLVKEAELPPGLHAAIHVPAERVATGSLKGTDFSKIESLVGEAWTFARQGEFAKAMILNSAAYAGALGRDIRFSLTALRDGAWAAGLTGKGPAEIALGSKRWCEEFNGRFPNTTVVKLRRRRDT